MPGVTTLAFYREKQTIDSFESNRPKSLPALRQAATSALDSVEKDISVIERHYLGQFNTQEEFIRSHTGYIKLLTDAASYKEILRKNDFEIIWDRVNSLGERTTAYLSFMKKLKELGAHISEINPSAFYQPMAAIEQILRYMDKYCLSFYTGPITMLSDPVLETPFIYEKHRIDRSQEVKMQIKKIPRFNESFQGAGLQVTQFSDHCQQLAGHCDCYGYPFFLLFPASIESLRECCRLLRQWLEEDREYVDCLNHDIQKFSQEHQQITSEYRELYERLYKLKHKNDGLHRDLEVAGEELGELRVKRPSAEADHHETLVAYKKCELSIEKAKFRLHELARNASQYSAEEFRTSVEEQRRLLKIQRKNFPDAKKMVKRAEKKVQWFQDKEDSYSQMQKEKAKSAIEIDECSRQLKLTKDKMQRIQDSIGKLKVIYNYKISSSTLKKVFHNLQLESRMQFLRRERSLPSILLTHSDSAGEETKDKLTLAMEVASRYIEQDWSRLFLALPFYPPRGQSEIEYDLNRIDKKFVRGNRRELARESLLTWRRLHTRANLDGLKAALCIIGREDITRRIMARLDRKRRQIVEAPPMSPTTRLLTRRLRQQDVESAPQTSRSLPRLLHDDTLY